MEAISYQTDTASASTGTLTIRNVDAPFTRSSTRPISIVPLSQGRISNLSVPNIILSALIHADELWSANPYLIAIDTPPKVTNWDRMLSEFSSTYPQEWLLGFLRALYTFAPYQDKEDIINWEVSIDTPPKRPKRTISAKLKHVGRSKPIPIDDPRSR